MPDPLNDPAVDAYVGWLREVKRAPENTIKARLRTLRSIGGTPSTATREDLEEWWTSRADRSPATRSNDLANARTFYTWCRTWDHRPGGDDPTLRLEGPKVAHGTPQWVSKPDLEKLLDTLPDDLARAVRLGAYAGLRVSEVARLSWSDVDLEMSVLRVYGQKTETYRAVKVSPLLLDQLLPYTGGNIVTGTRQPMTGATLQRRVNRAIKAAGVDATFHKLRHRYGTVAYQATGDLLAVAKQMGHASIVTTSGYAAASGEAADKIASAVMR